MRIQSLCAGLVAVTMFTCVVATPVVSRADQSRRHAIHHRQKTKNTWRNVAIGSGALGVLGFATGHAGLGLLGIGGAAYSASRYEHDRRSQSRLEHSRHYYHRRHRS